MKNRPNKKRSLITIGVLWAIALLVILVASLIPDNMPGSNFISTSGWNMAHIPAYALLMVVTIFLVAQLSPLTPIIIMLCVVSISLLGLSIELVQPIVGRMMSLGDLMYNEIGIGVGLVIVFIFPPGEGSVEAAIKVNEQM